MKRLNYCAVAVVLSAMALGCGQQPVVEQVAEYEAMTIATADTEVTSQFSASIRGRQDINIMPQVSGSISSVRVLEGESVKKGEVLFVIDQVPYKAALTTAEANVEAAKAAVETAELTYKSKQELYARSVISEYELSVSKNQLQSAKAAYAQAEAQRVNAANSLSYTEVKAPSAGVVGTIPYRVGALVGPSMAQPLTTVSDNSEMYVYFSINERELLKLTRQFGSMTEALKSLPEPELVLSDGSTYEHKGVIETISGVVDRATGSVSLRAVFPNPGRILLSGSTGNVVLRYMEKNSIVIPCSATYEVQDKTYVYQSVEGKAVSKIIEVSKYDGKNYIVRAGLEAGEVIITEGVAMLRENTPVSLKMQASADSAQAEVEDTAAESASAEAVAENGPVSEE